MYGWMFSVKAEIYHLLGVFAETYPAVMVTYSDRLLTVYIRTLKAEVRLMAGVMSTD